MEHINSILLVIQVLLSISLIALVLLQHGKGADAGAAFGSGASATVFGARGSGNFLSRATTVVAILFFIVCLALAYISSHRAASGGVSSSVTTQQTETAPTTPAMQQGSQGGSDLPPAGELNGGASQSGDAPQAGGASQSGTGSQSDLPPAE